MSPTFPEVASVIAKGPPPDWLARGLASFSRFIGGPRRSAEEERRYLEMMRQMRDAAELLIKRLPLMEDLPLGHLPYLAQLQDTLPKLSHTLTTALEADGRSGGHRPNVPRKVCAAVVVVAWTLIHGEPEPQSDALLQACNDYWQACGQPDRGDIENWRRDAREAALRRHAWIRRRFLAMQPNLFDEVPL